MNTNIPKRWTYKNTYKEDMIKILSKNETLSNYLKYYLRTDDNTISYKGYTSKDTDNKTYEQFLNTEANVNQKTKPISKTYSENNDEFYITGYGESFPKKHSKQCDDIVKETKETQDTQFENVTTLPNLTDITTVPNLTSIKRGSLKKEITSTQRNKVKELVFDNNDNTNNAINNTLNGGGSEIIVKQRSKRKLNTLKSNCLSDIINMKRGMSNDQKKSLFKQNLLGNPLILSTIKRSEQYEEDLKALNYKESKDTLLQMMLSASAKDKAANANNPEVNSTTKKKNSKNNHSNLSKFLHIDKEETRKISNSLVKMYLKEVNGLGPKYQYCKSCNNNNIYYYNEMKPVNAIKILQQIKNSKVVS